MFWLLGAGKWTFMNRIVFVEKLYLKIPALSFFCSFVLELFGRHFFWWRLHVPRTHVHKRCVNHIRILNFFLLEVRETYIKMVLHGRCQKFIWIILQNEATIVLFLKLYMIFTINTGWLQPIATNYKLEQRSVKLYSFH